MIVQYIYISWYSICLINIQKKLVLQISMLFPLIVPVISCFSRFCRKTSPPGLGEPHFQLPMEGILHQVLRPGSWPESSRKIMGALWKKTSTFWTQNHGGLEDDLWSPLSALFGSMRIFKNVTVMKVGLCMVWLGMKEGWGGSYLPLSLKVWHALSFKSSRQLDDHLTYKRWPTHVIKKQVSS